NIIEANVFHHNTRLAGNGAGLEFYPDTATGTNNLLLNNDSHHNGLAGTTGGDGIGCNSQATGTVIRGNRVWRDNDDGIDLWGAANVLVEGNWAWENGLDDNLVKTSGNGTGFKLGGDPSGDGNHTIRYNLAWNNGECGTTDFSANLGPRKQDGSLPDS